MRQEEDRVRGILRNMEQGSRAGRQLKWLPREKRIRAVGDDDPDGKDLEVTAEDITYFTDEQEHSHDRHSC